MSSDTQTKIDYSVWDDYWSRQNISPAKDDVMCLFLALQIAEECNTINGEMASSALEMGAGSGRTSRYLNEMGAETGILDISEEALRLASYVTRDLPNAVELYLEDIFKVTPKTFSRKYSVVWNAGVLEHFIPADQREILNRMAMATSDGGFLLLLTPYSGSLVYRIGKFVLEKIGAFPYGREIPVRTIEPVLPQETALIKKERSVGFVILIFNSFKALSNLPLIGGLFSTIDGVVNPIWCALLKNKNTRTWVFFGDRILSKIFGGYLLLSICRSSSK